MSKATDIANLANSIDADSLNGKVEDANATANTIPVRDNDTAIIGKNQCTAWAVASYDGTNIIIHDSYNVASITRVDAGKGVLTFLNDMNNTDYLIVGSNDGYLTVSSYVQYDSQIGSKSASSFGFRCVGHDGSVQELKNASILVFGGK